MLSRYRYDKPTLLCHARSMIFVAGRPTLIQPCYTDTTLLQF